jgi:hypothetical protein
MKSHFVGFPLVLASTVFALGAVVGADSASPVDRSSVDATGQVGGFLAPTPVPESASWFMVGSGALSLVRRARCRSARRDATRRIR